ncbi:GEVED domain-containing protein [Kitasatospora phosalacinea]|uniref:GEVED domain-containing protein n=1 Tax=Kitasatospora phosalacinea TaxID=2065 RepID=A0ABW6GLV0_9ACTN
MSVLLSTALGLAGVLGATGPQPAVRGAQPATRAPGTPGVPQDPTVVYTEDFENAPADKPVRLTGYTGATGETYTAHANWLTGCNGWVLDNTATSNDYAPGIADCGNTESFWNASRGLAAVLGRYNGTAVPDRNQAVTAFTYNSPGANRVEFETVQPIPLPRTNRFLAFSVNSAATNCQVSAPQLNFFLLDGATAVPASAKPLNPCTDPAATSYTVDGKAYKAVGRASDAPVLFAGSELGIRMTNANGSGTGNDAAFDDIKVLDVTPQVDKAFTPAVATAGGTSTLVFTVTNTSDLAAKKGWSFTDTLPAGLTVAGPAPAQTTCTNGKVSSDNGLDSVALSGDLTAGQASCTLAVQVTAATGTYRNCAENIGDAVGVDLPDCAEVRFVTPRYTITKTSDPADGSPVLPGQRVEYRVVVTNPGEVPVDAKIDDDLTAVLDDAVYDNDAAATTGTPAFTSPHLTWAETLAPGASATVTYSVTVNDPDTGDRKLKNAVTGTEQSNCPTGTEAGCTTGQDSPHLTIQKTATPGSTQPGGRVDYTVTVTNDGTGPYAGAKISDDLTGVLDDATYNGDLTADSGTATYAAPHVDWNGDLAPGQTVTLRYSVTVNTPDTGDKHLTNAVVGPDGSDCTTCTTDTPVATLVIAKQADQTSARPGGTVGYTVTVANDGTAPYAGATMADDLTLVIDDATYNGDLTADSGTATYTAPEVGWSGDVAAGQTVTIRYSVTVNDPDTGDKHLVNAVVGPDGSNCAAGSTDPRCKTVLPTPRFDFGDAPDSFGTLQGSNGAKNEVVDGLSLGGAVSSEDDGRPGEDANGDSDDALDAAPVLHQHSGEFDLVVKVTDSTGHPALVGGWIDADRNRRFDAHEVATATVAPGATAVTLHWSGLDPATAGRTFLRLRIFGDDSLSNVRALATPSPLGYGGPGETEDYVATVEPTALVIAKTASTDRPAPGEQVSYTVTVHSDGPAPYQGAAFTDDLTGLLDDAAYNGDATATTGTATYTAPKLQWTGDLAAGQTATLTYSVTVADPLRGDGRLDNAVTGDNSNCATGSTDPRCATHGKVPPPPHTPTPQTPTPHTPTPAPTVPAAHPALPSTGAVHPLAAAALSVLALGAGLLLTLAAERRRRVVG